MQKMHDRKNVGKIIIDPSLPPKIKVKAPDVVETEDNAQDPAF